MTGTDLGQWERDLQTYIRFYNAARLHSALGSSAPARFARQWLPPPSHLS